MLLAHFITALLMQAWDASCTLSTLLSSHCFAVDSAICAANSLEKPVDQVK